MGSLLKKHNPTDEPPQEVAVIKPKETIPCSNCGIHVLVGKPHEPSFCIGALQAALRDRDEYIRYQDDLINHFVSSLEPVLPLVLQMRERGGRK